MNSLSRFGAGICLTLLILLAVILRVRGAGLYYYNPDEALIVGIAAGRDLAEVWQFSHYEVHPPLFYFLCHYWMLISDAPAFVRALPLILGILLIAVHYRIGKFLDDEVTGLCCALLITLSPACIVQSYIVRQYMLLALLLSLSFYWYLRWRENHGIKPLAMYTLFGMLAVLTHFSAAFYVACVGTFEAGCLLLQPAARRKCVLWLAANGLIAAAAGLIFLSWRPYLSPFTPYFYDVALTNAEHLLRNTMEFPLAVSGYIYPAPLLAVVLLLYVVFTALLKPAALAPGGTSLRLLILLMACGLIFGMLLLAGGMYGATNSYRRSLWLLPLLIPPAGWGLAGLIKCWLRATPPKYGRFFSLSLAALLLITCYAQALRYTDGGEYAWRQSEWDAFKKRMDEYGPGDLVVIEKSYGLMLANLYAPMSSGAFAERRMASLAPYHDTHILFNPYYPYFYSSTVLLDTLQEAEASGMLQGIDRIIFLRMLWDRTPVVDLILCHQLTKQIAVVRAPNPDGTVTKGDILSSKAVLLSVSKETLDDELLSPGGAALGCLH